MASHPLSLSENRAFGETLSQAVSCGPRRVLVSAQHMSNHWQSASGTAWRRWRLFAHRAAEIQSRALLFLLYFVMLAPIALVMRIAGRRSATSGEGAWQSVTSPPETLESAKNQF